MEAATPIVTRLAPAREHAHVPRDVLAAKYQDADNALEKVEASPMMAGIEIFDAAAIVRRRLVEVRGLNWNAPAYRAAEALEAVIEQRRVASAAGAFADREARTERARLQDLGMVRPATDVIEAGMDRECRDYYRGLPPAKQAALLEQLREGLHPRVALGLARSPIQDDVAQEAAQLFGKFSEPARRANVEFAIESMTARRTAASLLIGAADKVADAIRARIEAAAAMAEDQRNAFSAQPTVTHV